MWHLPPAWERCGGLGKSHLRSPRQHPPNIPPIFPVLFVLWNLMLSADGLSHVLYTWLLHSSSSHLHRWWILEGPFLPAPCYYTVHSNRVKGPFQGWPSIGSYLTPSSVFRIPHIDRALSTGWGPFLSGMLALYNTAQAHLGYCT